MGAWKKPCTTEGRIESELERANKCTDRRRHKVYVGISVGKMENVIKCIRLEYDVIVVSRAWV